MVHRKGLKKELNRQREQSPGPGRLLPPLAQAEPLANLHKMSKKSQLPLPPAPAKPRPHLLRTPPAARDQPLLLNADQAKAPLSPPLLNALLNPKQPLDPLLLHAWPPQLPQRGGGP